MDIVSKIAVVLFAAFLIWMLFRFLKANPESLSLPNINKSMLTMGIVGVGLIIFIGLVVWLLRA